MPRLIDADELYQKVVGYNGGAVDKTVAKRLIDQMPTVDVRENVHGEWIDDYDPAKFGEFRYKCSKCGARTVEWADNFCYQCGAYMRGEEDD